MRIYTWFISTDEQAARRAKFLVDKVYGEELHRVVQDMHPTNLWGTGVGPGPEGDGNQGHAYFHQMRNRIGTPEDNLTEEERVELISYITQEQVVEHDWWVVEEEL